jgi:hypothetical protein
MPLESVVQIVYLQPPHMSQDSGADNFGLDWGDNNVFSSIDRC